MFGAYASVVLVCAASLVVGQAILLVCGRREASWLAGPVGLAALLVSSGLAIKLPGHGTTVAIVAGVLVVASAFVLVVGALSLRRSDGSGAGLALVAAAFALIATSIPFIANERVGILGVGLVNDDMAYHLLIADWLNTRLGDMPVLVHQGYPVGPHALAGGLSEALGTGLVEAFAGLTLAIPVLTALVAFEALPGLRGAPRVIAAALTSLPYLVTAYLAQEAFKEPIIALFLLGFVLLLPSISSPLRAVPLGVIAAGAVYAYSFPALFWLAAAAAIYLLVGLVRRAPDSRRASLWAIGAAIAVLALLTAPEWSRMVDFGDFRAFRTSNLSGGLGNLRHQLSPLEAFGIWPTSEFRLAAGDSGHAAAFYAGAAIAVLAFAIAIPRWVRRYGPAVPAALGAAILAYAGARLFGTVYTSAKALAIAAPFVALIAFGGLLAWDPGSTRRRVMGSLAFVLVVGMAVSSFLVLRQAPVGPTNHADQLAELRPLVEGQKVLFLGRDNFVAYELRGARPFTAVRNYYAPYYVKPDLHLRDVFRKFDFDSVTAATLDRFPYVITTRAAYASGPPTTYEVLRKTPDFALWKRTGPAGPRQVLDEGVNPGVELQCSGRPGQPVPFSPGGEATVFSRPPVVGGTWEPGSTVEAGSPVTQELQLPTGRWEISISYDATQALHVSAPGFAASLPANLDYRGSVPYFPVGRLTVDHGGPVRFTVEVADPPALGLLLGTKAEAHLGAIAASPAGAGVAIPGEAERSIPLADACGRYVDWFRSSATH
ncbi:MAG: hypothetical protein ACJ75I_05550 [Solirubrobacterales bacterium]